jgi:MFS transporter, DHA2 family, multidrug resistance protein
MPVSPTRRWWALVAISVSVLVVSLDLTVLSLALPDLSRSLHASTSDLQWFTDAYTLVLAAALLPAGLLSDRLGRKKVLLGSLALFGCGSAACAYASSAGELIAARAVLGLGAAAIMPLSMAILPVLFTAEERPKAIALMAGASFVGYPVGPLLGGWLLDNFWWGSVFLINVPVVVLALATVAVLMPESRSEQRPGIDATGVALSSLGLIGLTYGFIKAGQNGWGDVAALATVGAGAAVLAIFVAWERRMSRRAASAGGAGGGPVPPARRQPVAGGRHQPLARPASRQPLVDLTLFRSAGFTWGTILITLVSFAMLGLFFAMPQYFQEVRGADALRSGLLLLPMVGGMMAGMVAGTRLQSAPRGRPGGAPLVNAKVLTGTGFTVMAAALAAGAFTRVSSGTGFTVAWFAISGVGLGVALPTAMNAAIGALSAERSGAGSALIRAMQQVGATIGVAILGTVLSSGYRSHLNLTGLPAAVAGAVRSSVTAGVAVAHGLRSAPLLDAVRTAFTHGLDTTLWVCCGIAAASALVALALLPRRAGAATSPRAAGDETAAPGQAELRHGSHAEH